MPLPSRDEVERRQESESGGATRGEGAVIVAAKRKRGNLDLPGT